MRAALGTRDLNRALLHRQMLLERRRMRPLRAIERLVALQAQAPKDPYVGLWSRLERFRPAALSDDIADRRAVRMPLLRATLHLVTARDALALRPLVEPALQRTLHAQSPYGRRLAGLDVKKLVVTAARLLEERPRTRAELAPLLQERWPHHDGSSLAYAVTYLLPLVQVPPRGLWGRSGPAAFTTLQGWLAQAPGPGGPLDPMILRYLEALGPATPADLRTWSGVRGVNEMLDRLRPRLRTFRDDHGRELFDTRRAPLPDPDTPAPVRFLPEYDNALLAHADRGRIVPSGIRWWTEVGWGTVLVDGFVAARWRLGRRTSPRSLTIEPFRRLTRSERAEIAEEGSRLGSFLAGDRGSGPVDISLTS
jgi:hypothetical protein